MNCEIKACVFNILWLKSKLYLVNFFYYLILLFPIYLKVTHLILISVILDDFASIDGHNKVSYEIKVYFSTFFDKIVDHIQQISFVT